MIAFQPDGPILSFTADTSAPTSVQVVPSSVQSGQVILTNTDATDDCVVGWGQNDAAAKANAVAGNSQNQYFLLHGTQVVITATGPYFTGIAGASCVVKVQAGTGN